MTRIDWTSVLDRAVPIVNSYDTGVTLRQLFYRLVSAQTIPNIRSAYQTLSAKTAEGRRDGTFPDLVDRGRQIHRAAHWDSPSDALDALAGQFRLDRTEKQDVSIFVGVEKAGLVMQLESWFGGYGIPVVALGGFASQTIVKRVVNAVDRYDRDAVLLYSGDFDPSGEDIERDFVGRSDCWAKVVKVALTADQVDEYQLPENPGKTTDSRSAAFVARHGRLVQVELDALPPDVLRALYQMAVDEFLDRSRYLAVLERERADVEQLRTVAGRLR